MKCSCCGEERDVLASLQCHDDIKVCPTCVEWLRHRVGAPVVTPILPIADMPAAIEFYESAGFDVEPYEGGGYAFVEFGGVSVFDLDVVDGVEPSTNGAGCYIITADVDELHSAFSAAGLSVTGIENQPWGMREFTLTDPSGNHLRIGRNV